MALVEIDMRPILEGLQRATADIKADAAQIIALTAQRLRSDLQRTYRRGPTGHLQSWITVRLAPRQGSDPILRTWQVRAFAPHVHIYERGTRERFDATRHNARRGRSPAHGEILARLASQHRREMVQAIARRLQADRRIV